MDTGDVISVAVDGSGHAHTTTMSQAALLELQQQQLILATAASATPNGSINGIQVQEPSRGLEMIEFFRKQREREKFCDVILHVGGKQFFAHRMVLAAGSAYFDSIFKSKKTLREHLAVSCQEPEVFQNFLNYFYTGSILLKKENVGELIRLSHHFLVGKLKSYCAEFLERYMDTANCLQVKQTSEKYHLPSLTKAAINFITRNLAEVINHEIMMDLPPKQIEGFVTEKAYGIPHDAAVKFMSRWVCHDIPNRERDFKQFLTHIDWHSMDPNLIIDYIDQEPLYGASERCFYYVLHSLAEKGIQVEKYEPMFQALEQRFGLEPDPALGYGDNLLQMAFNSAMEGLTDSTSLMLDGRDNNQKWPNPHELHKPRTPKQKSKLPLTIEQKRRRILAKLRKNRKMQRWVRLTRDRSNIKRKRLVPDTIEESSGDEECDPVQTENGYRCHLCPFNTKKVSRLERHVSGVHAHDVTYKCGECGFNCKWNRDYFMHMKTHYEGPPYKCHSCEYQCMKIGSLICHKMGHIEQKPYQCCDCEYKCRSKANLAAHLKSHNNEKPYRCNVCGRTFASKNSLDQHAVGHSTEKTYSCTQCSFTTKQLGQFTNHKRTQHHNAPSVTAAAGPSTSNAGATVSGASASPVVHPNPSSGTGKKTKNPGAAPASVKQKSNGGEVLRCQDSQCKYTTTKKSQLDSHMRSHAGVRPHPCTICGRRFLEKSHLVRHERIHYNERPFKCEECDYASTRRDKLKEHKTRHHGINASAKSPYKPRPHKASKQSSFGDQTLVYAKKSTVQQATAASSTPTASTAQSTGPQQTQAVVQQQQVQEQQQAGSSDLEFIIPHTHITSDGGTGGGAAYTHALIGAQGNHTIDLQQMANSGQLVQLRQFQGGKEIQVAHTLASIPSSLTSNVGLKLDELQSQAILSGRPIKLEDLGVSVQNSSGGTTQGMANNPSTTSTRLGGSTTTTMVIDANTLQQLGLHNPTSTTTRKTITLQCSKGGTITGPGTFTLVPSGSGSGSSASQTITFTSSTSSTAGIPSIMSTAPGIPALQLSSTNHHQQHHQSTSSDPNTPDYSALLF